MDPTGDVRWIWGKLFIYAPASTASACPGNLFPPQPTGSMVLAEQLAYCRFAYHEAIPEALDQGNWVNGWNRPTLPSAVRVEMAPREFNPSRLPIATLHIPIHV